MRKYLTTIIITFAYLNILSAQKLKVVSSASIFHDMVQQIAGDLVDAEVIVPIGGDPHIYEPTPSDAKKIQDADLIFVNGMTFEGWMDKVIANSGTGGRRVLITEGINPIASQQYKNSVDPHAWMDASNGVIYADNILKALVTSDPENEDFYTSNHDKYVLQLKELDKYIKAQINSVPESKRVLITSHDAFAYYARRYGILNVAIMGISTEADAQTSDIIRVSSAIKQHKVPAIFVESTINPKMIQQIAKDTGVKVGGELYADSLGDPQSEGGTYIGMLRHNTDTIVKALREQKTEVVNAQEEHSIPLMWVIGSIVLLLIVLLYFIFRQQKH